ncbi:hypothetical protein ACRQ5Q_43400 (plasmid) [Bradyrhizobium sp. PMVTL-01]|uniref:hypothetical protein n=1 Tax=Bradyrhizobium sp. PMVTL-01 TaxID=3434999 RepID=UPI003F6FC502
MMKKDSYARAQGTGPLGQAFAVAPRTARAAMEARKVVDRLALRYNVTQSIKRSASRLTPLSF